MAMLVIQLVILISRSVLATNGSLDSKSVCSFPWKMYSIGAKFKCFKNLGEHEIKAGRGKCAAIGAKLPLPDSHKEDFDLHTVMKSFSVEACALDGSDKEKEATWKDSLGNVFYQDGNKIGYTNWDKGQPDNNAGLSCFGTKLGCMAKYLGKGLKGQSQHYLRKIENGKWDDSEGGKTVNILCEKPAVDSISWYFISSACSIQNSKAIRLHTKTFCIADLGKHNYSEGDKICKAHNSTFPLPKTLAEQKALQNLMAKIGVTEIYLDMNKKPDSGNKFLYLYFN